METITQEKDTATNKEALAKKKAIKHSSKVEDKEQEDSKIKGELSNIP